MEATALYNAIVLELERRRLHVGISMERMSDLAGSAERSYAKILYPDTVSGRVARWETLQAYMQVLFCEGFVLRIEPTTTGMLTAEGTKRRILQEAATWDRSSRRRLMRDLAKLAVEARQRKLSPERRSEMARHAACEKWRKIRALKVSDAQRDVENQVAEHAAAK